MSAGTAVRGKRGAKGAVFLVLVVAVLVGLTAFFSDQESSSDEPLDPKSWRKDGGHALAELLRQQGVDLRVVRTAQEAQAETTNDTLLFVSNSRYLVGEESLRQVAALPGDRVVLDSSYYSQLRVLAPGIEYGSKTAMQQPREPGCAWSGANRAGAVAIGGQVYQVQDVVDSCYDGVVLRYRQDGRLITVVGSGGFMANAGIAEPGAAALALNLLGTRHTVIWLAPQFPQTTGAKVGPDLMSLVPDRIWWATRTLAVAVVLTALWQARRLGPIVVERLPVVVRASETSEGLGKLYQARRAKDRAASALRGAALARLSKRLAIPARAQDVMAAALAARAGRSPEEIKSVLYGRDPADDSELVALAEQLDILERSVFEGKVRGV
ncbi:DUF4350 domain-containing protein [Segniliparus rugosus]|uniref:DUF4350 domain-containing protein n=1 Tax=Segniliparus rugosus TaxID=286804 RepID=UPI000307C0A5|nr:DUF4350 domain-containing protein [Segniliparus rugosus]